jgi:signal transduction histidine kinase
MAFDLLQAEERERRRLAADLHDQVAQTLALSKIKLRMLRESLSSTVYAEPLDEISGIIAQTINNIRAMTFDLSPPDLYELGLSSALEGLCERFHDKYRLTIYFSSDKRISRIDDETSVLIFRAVQELLFNIVKHASANIARVSLEKDSNLIKISISDDGVGFDPSTINNKGHYTGFGIFSIRERLKGIGGQMQIKSRHGFGTHISIIVPVSPSGIP